MLVSTVSANVSFFVFASALFGWIASLVVVITRRRIRELMGTLEVASDVPLRYHLLWLLFCFVFQVLAFVRFFVSPLARGCD